MAGKLEGDEQLLAVGLQHSRGLLPYTIYTHRDLKGLQIGELPVSGTPESIALSAFSEFEHALEGLLNKKGLRLTLTVRTAAQEPLETSSCRTSTNHLPSSLEVGSSSTVNSDSAAATSSSGSYSHAESSSSKSSGLPSSKVAAKATAHVVTSYDFVSTGKPPRDVDQGSTCEGSTAEEAAIISTHARFKALNRKSLTEPSRPQQPLGREETTNNLPVEGAGHEPGMAIQAPAGISTNKMKNRVVIRLLSQGSAAAGVAGTDVTAGQQEEEAKPCHDDLDFWGTFDLDDEGNLVPPAAAQADAAPPNAQDAPPDVAVQQPAPAQQLAVQPADEQPADEQPLAAVYRDVAGRLIRHRFTRLGPDQLLELVPEPPSPCARLGCSLQRLVYHNLADPTQTMHSLLHDDSKDVD